VSIHNLHTFSFFYDRAMKTIIQSTTLKRRHPWMFTSACQRWMCCCIFELIQHTHQTCIFQNHRWAVRRVQMDKKVEVSACCNAFLVSPALVPTLQWLTWYVVHALNKETRSDEPSLHIIKFNHYKESQSKSTSSCCHCSSHHNASLKMLKAWPKRESSVDEHESSQRKRIDL
jgi:hypothetical protein